ncbi:DUF4394 domain-containing protein [Capilliphycus salinus ALCB114379]|uniref:DUF4394 domain-containing protein n=1 Tax=Capilliphycus salinus TaxID=2768948 RepID=UPI0039A6252D
MENLAALTDNNTLLIFNSSNPGQVTTIAVTGIEGTLLGIDTRPANGLIYGLTTANNLYTIDPSSGVATLASTLSQPFEGGTISGFDFNPAADRLRLVGDNDQDFRINVDTGAVIVDGTLAFAQGDVNAGINPNVTASAYTNSFAGTTSTQLYNIDTLLNTLVLQNPPNDGILVTVGELGLDFDTLGGFDIASSPNGSNTAFAASNSMLYTVDLATGTATNVGMIGDDANLNLQGLAVLDPLTGDFVFDPAQYLASNLDLAGVFGFDLAAANQHYLQFGMNENRPVDTFDEVRYLASNQDLITVFGFNPEFATEHYVRFGIAEGRSTDSFSPVSYLNNNADLQAFFGNDLGAATQHYVQFGFAEGRMV